MESFRRPKPGENEEELLRQMEDFEQKKQQPSISSQNVINLQKRKVSKFAEKRKTATAKVEKPEAESSANVLQAVVKEREFDYDQFLTATLNKKPSQVAFPSVMKLDKMPEKSSGGKSLFALQIAQSPIEETTPLKSSVSASDHSRFWGEKSRILRPSSFSVLNEKDIDDIHEANIAILDARSDEQLKKDREELLATMNPDVVQFLLKRKATKRQIDGHESAKEPPGQDQTEEAPKKLLLESKYLHMQKVEAEKMQWMEDALEEKVKNAVNFSARFDFKGDLLPYDSDSIPPNAGLHHHGEEPHRPGYTLEELMTLARSSNAQQASIAIQTLGNIIKNERLGRFIGCFDNDNVLTKLLDAELVTILRISLDNHHSEVLMDAAIQAMSELFYVELEEQALDSTFFHAKGHVQPSLLSKLAEDKDFKEESLELKDIQVMNADLVLGLLRTNLLDRLCYLIEIQKVKSAATVSALLKILIRFARHSLSVASGLAKHGRLIKVVFDNFLPYSSPIHYALKFIRLLMSWGRNIAKDFLANYDLGAKILCFLSIEPDSKEVFLQESLRLIVEAGRTWIVLLKYGLGSDLFMEYHPILIKHMVYLNTHLSMTDDDQASKFNYHFAVVIFDIIKAALKCTPNDDELFLLEDKKAVQILEWSTFTGILEALEICIKKWAVEMARLSKQLTFFSADLMSSTLALYSVFFHMQAKSRAFDQVTFLQQMESLVAFLSPLLTKSPTIDGLVGRLAGESFFSKKSLIDGRSRDPSNLPSLGIVGIYHGKSSLMTSVHDPFCHLAAFLQFLNSAKTSHSGIDIMAGGDFLDNFNDYLSVVVDSSFAFKGSRSNWFCRGEIYFLHQLILAFILHKKTYDRSLVLRASLSLITHYQIGDRSWAEDLMKKVIFNEDFLGVDFLASLLETTSLDNHKFSLNLKTLYEMYSKLVLVSTKEDHTTPFSIGSLVLTHHGETLLPADWQYLPLLTLLNTKKEDIASNTEIEAVKSCLIWVRVINNCIGIKSAVFAYSRLATVFLAASDLFLDPQIKALIKENLADILASRKSLVFSKNLPGIESFKEFYKELVQQFQAVSYGDPAFALMLLLPMTKGNDKALKSILWIDHMECLRSITLKVEDLIGPLLIEDFIETDNDLVRAHMKALVTKIVLPRRNPLLYQIMIANLKSVSDKDPLRSDIDKLLSQV